MIRNFNPTQDLRNKNIVQKKEDREQNQSHRIIIYMKNSYIGEKLRRQR